MVSRIKTQLYNLITELGYNVADNRNNTTTPPWLLIRTNGHNRHDTADLRYDNITIVVDIFSAYSGEKEVLEMIENISNNIQRLKNDNNSIIHVEQQTCLVLDDNETGPIRKHGVVAYRFVCASYINEEDT